MVEKVRFVSVTLQFSFFLVFICFLGVAKNYLYLHIVSSLASFWFLTYELR